VILPDPHSGMRRPHLALNTGRGGRASAPVLGLKPWSPSTFQPWWRPCPYSNVEPPSNVWGSCGYWERAPSFSPTMYAKTPIQRRSITVASSFLIRSVNDARDLRVELDSELKKLCLQDRYWGSIGFRYKLNKWVSMQPDCRNTRWSIKRDIE